MSAPQHPLSAGMNRLQARGAVQARGYTVHAYDTQSGDGPHGSREYWEKPDTRRNDHGAAMDYATISLVEGRWLTSFFGED